MKAKWFAAMLSVGLVVAVLPGLAGKKEPDRVKVQHILIGYKSSIPGQELDRTRRDAKLLAYELLDRAQAGEDFDALVKEYTNENYPGYYLLTNVDTPAVRGGYKRVDMALRFGDVSFSLEVGEVGLATHHATLSPFGYHIIKRIE